MNKQQHSKRRNHNDGASEIAFCYYINARFAVVRQTVSAANRMLLDEAVFKNTETEREARAELAELQRQAMRDGLRTEVFSEGLSVWCK